MRDIDECLGRVGIGSVLVWLGGTKSPGRPGRGEGHHSAQARALIIRIGESRAFNYAFMLIPGQFGSVRFVAGALILFWVHPSYSNIGKPIFITPNSWLLTDLQYNPSRASAQHKEHLLTKSF